MLYLPGLKNKMNDSQQLDAQDDFGKFNVQCESESQYNTIYNTMRTGCQVKNSHLFYAQQSSNW